MNGDDPSAVANHFLADARLYPEDGAMVEGIDAIVEFRGGLIKGPASIDLQMVSVEMIGDAAVETGTFALTLPNDDGGETVLNGKTMVIWRQADDGSWKVAHDMWNDGT